MHFTSVTPCSCNIFQFQATSRILFPGIYKEAYLKCHSIHGMVGSPISSSLLPFSRRLQLYITMSNRPTCVEFAHHAPLVLRHPLPEPHESPDDEENNNDAGCDAENIAYQAPRPL